MLIAVYDIKNDKLRTQLSKCLKKYGRRIQYSVFEIINSPRIIKNIKVDIDTQFAKRFGQSDSVIIFDIPENAKIMKFGYPLNEEKELLFMEIKAKKQDDDNCMIF